MKPKKKDQVRKHPQGESQDEARHQGDDKHNKHHAQGNQRK
jgi:hypothetical protein